MPQSARAPPGRRFRPEWAAGTAGPAETVPVAFIGRTSTLVQDPVASLRRQVRKSQDWLPAGFKIIAWYWDVESGALDLEVRSQGDNWQAAAGAGIPRDGGVADLLRAARSPSRRSRSRSAKTSGVPPATAGAVAAAQHLAAGVLRVG